MTYDYDFNWNSPYGHVVKLIESLQRSPGLIVDLGCGRAAMAEVLIGLGFGYLGLDLDPDSIEALRARGLEAVRVDLAAADSVSDEILGLVGGRPVSAICMLDTLEHLPDPATTIRVLHSVAASLGRPPLLLSIPNVGHFDLAAKLSTGDWHVTPTGLLDETHLQFFTSHRLNAMLAEQGWVEVARNDFDLYHSDQHFPPLHPALADGSMLQKFLRELRDRAGGFSSVNQFVRAYTCGDVPVPDRQTDGEPSFNLTVVVRTMGTRLPLLGEALLCLAAQTVSSFEVLLMVHSSNPEAMTGVRRLVGEFAPNFTRLITLVQVEGGERAKPLNRALQLAAGTHVAFLDDDDLVTADWVETFGTASESAKGALVRAVTADQKIEATSDQLVPYRPVSGFLIDEHRIRFDFAHHLRNNRTPFCSFAVPMDLVRVFGLEFDSSLEVLEDWDFLLTAASIVGVWDSARVTSIYRRWEGNQSSWNAVDREVWNHNRRAIQERLNRRPLLFPAGSVAELIELQIHQANVARLETQLEKAVSQAAALEKKRAQLTAALDISTKKLDSSNMKTEEHRAALAKTKGRLREIEQSTAWRLTAPLRWAMDLIRGLGRRRR